MTDHPRIKIAGGAGPEEAAAIMAAISHLEREEDAARAIPSQRPRQSAWVLAWRPRHTNPPLPSHTYDAVPWAEVEGEDTPG